jgi:hypothetical protein
MRLIFCFATLLTTFGILSQTEDISFIDTDFKKEVKYIENYSLVNQETGNLVLVLAQGAKIKAYLYTKDLKEQATISGTHLKKKYNNYIGYNITGSTYTLFFSSDNKKKYASVIFDFSSGISTIQEIAIDLYDEKLINFINLGNKLLLLTEADNNILVIKEFNQEQGFVVLGSFSFGESEQEQLKERISLFDGTKYGNTRGNITLIDHRVPNSIERTAAENKIYINGNSLVFSFEDEENETILHTIDLSDLSHKRQTYSYPIALQEEFEKFNSLLYENTLYHIAVSKSELSLQIKNLQSGEIINEYRASKDEEITFKNSPLYQNGSAMGMYGSAIKGNNRKVLKTTKQFLRKLVVSDIGISVEKVNEKILLTIGGIDNGANGNSSSIGNPTYASYNSYVSAISKYFNSILNKDYTVLKNSDFTYENVFDRMKKFEESLSWDISHDIFYRKGKLYFSYWDIKEQRYVLLSF